MTRFQHRDGSLGVLERKGCFKQIAFQLRVGALRREEQGKSREKFKKRRARAAVGDCRLVTGELLGSAKPHLEKDAASRKALLFRGRLDSQFVKQILLVLERIRLTRGGG